jgi:hypothetical protein
LEYAALNPKTRKEDDDSTDDIIIPQPTKRYLAFIVTPLFTQKESNFVAWYNIKKVMSCLSKFY